jgi:hypothetical protein
MENWRSVEKPFESIAFVKNSRVEHILEKSVFIVLNPKKKMI